MERDSLSASTLDLESLAESAELEFAMVFVFGRFVHPDHRFRQIRIFAPTLHTPGAEEGAFRGHPSGRCGIGSVVYRFRIQGIGFLQPKQFTIQ